MSQWLLLFGRSPQLSLAEFKSVFPNWSYQLVDQGELAERLLIIDQPSQITAQQLIDRLAGVVKIFQLEQLVKRPVSAADLQELLVDLLLEHSSQPYFGFYQAGLQQLSLSNRQLKNAFKQRGIKSRYFDSQLEASAISLHQDKAQEVFLYYQPQEILVARLLVSQNIDDWQHRDRAKPYSDRRKGMLPPKIARMMVNISLGQYLIKYPQSQAADLVLYDPFCGTAATLAEALSLGCQVYGSDLDPQAVEGAKRNLTWFCQQYALTPQDFEHQLFVRDIGQLSQADLPAVDLLVTEPFLGKQTPQDSQLDNIFKGLNKLYLGAFKRFSQVLKPGAVLVVIFPKVEGQYKTYDLRALIDKLALNGYNLVVPPLVYARKRARVQREIYCLEFNPRK